MQSAVLKISNTSLQAISGEKVEEEGFAVCQICLSQQF